MQRMLRGARKLASTVTFCARFRDPALLIGLCAVVFFLNLWGYPLFDVDEPRYAETAREMLTLPGDWITPHFNGVTRFDKPPLVYWLMAFSYRLFGLSEGSARLISAFAAVLTTGMLYAWCRTLFSARMALITACLFATMLEVVMIGRWAITDMTLACWMTGTALCLYLAGVRSPKWFLPAGAFAGLGLLTKGPVALVLPGGLWLLAFLLWHRHRWRVLLSPWLWGGLLLCAAIAMPWYVAVARANPETFVGNFFFLHNVQRFAATVSGHSGPWYYYLPVILIGSFPWCLFFPTLVYTGLQERGRLPDPVRYALLWFGGVLLFFSLAGTKLLTYILPGFPALAILLGWALETHISTYSGVTQARLWANRGIWVMAGVALMLLIVLVNWPYLLIAKPLRPLYQPVFSMAALGILCVTLVAVGVQQLSPHKQFRAWATLVVGMAVFYSLVHMVLLPEAAQITQADILSFARRAVADDMLLATYKLKKPSLVFYTRRKVYFIPEIATPVPGQPSAPLSAKAHPVYVVIKNREIPKLQAMTPLQPVQTGVIYSLIRLPEMPHTAEVNQ